MKDIPSAKETIIRFIQKGIEDPTFAPLHLVAAVDSVDAKTTRTDLVRDGQSLWDGSLYRDQMRGRIETYPIINFTKVPWGIPESIPFSSVTDGTLRRNMQRRLNELLAELPFQMRPSDSFEVLKKQPFTEYDYRISFKLHRRDGIPEWITIPETFSMSGSWKVYLKNPSPERTLVEKLLEYEGKAADLARLKANPPIQIEKVEQSMTDLGRTIAQELEQLAA